jgi:hypothetical protein
MAAPQKRHFACRKCGLILPAEVFNTPEPAACPGCRNTILGRVFPAFLTGPREGHAGEVIGIDELSSCFFHPTRRAVVPCGECGRFLCALCDLEIEGRHLCPPCLEAGRKQASLAVFHTSHTRWDNIAMLLAIVPLVTVIGWYFSMFTSAAAVFISIWKWRSPKQSMIPYSQGRFIVALLISALTLAGWALVLYFVLSRRLR